MSQEFKQGDWVTHPKQMDWGLGRVLSQDGSKLQVMFSSVGEKKIDTRFVSLIKQSAPPDAHAHSFKLRALRSVDTARLERACAEFHSQMKDRRSNTDDGRVATKVLAEMKANGDLSRSTMKQLFAWCHTGGSYTEGVDLAQEICRIIYGRVPTRAEVEAAGL